MSLTAADIKNKQFNTKMRGYDREEVDNFLNDVLSTVNELNTKIESLQDSLKSNEEQLKYFTELKDSLNKSILVAQEAADKVKNNAKKESDIMVREAQKQATDIVSEANAKANQVVEDTANETQKLTTETNDLKKQTRIFRQRLQVMLESQLEVVKSSDWDDLLATDDLSKYDEIQRILGTHLDSDSGNSVESSTTADSQPAAVDFTPADYNADENQADTNAAPEAADQNQAPSSDANSDESSVQQATQTESNADSTDQPTNDQPQDPQQGQQGQTVVIFPDSDESNHN